MDEKERILNHDDQATTILYYIDGHCVALSGDVGHFILAFRSISDAKSFFEDGDISWGIISHEYEQQFSLNSNNIYAELYEAEEKFKTMLAQKAKPKINKVFSRLSIQDFYKFIQERFGNKYINIKLEKETFQLLEEKGFKFNYFKDAYKHLYKEFYLENAVTKESLENFLKTGIIKMTFNPEKFVELYYDWDENCSKPYYEWIENKDYEKVSEEELGYWATILENIGMKEG